MPEALSNPPIQIPSRRSFLCNLGTVGASLGLAAKAFASRSDKESETVFRMRTPECEVRMSIEHFGNSEISNFRFRDSLTHQAFCLSASGEEEPNCTTRFSGSMAIAHYHFRSRIHAGPPLHVRERVLTIDHDSRMDPRPPFERLLAVQRETVSDIQAFGYQRGRSTLDIQSLALWCLVRQDLFLNEQPSAFLIVHWKHTFEAIHLLDIIPGEQTELLQT
jgi:hypothetical protein